MNHLQNWWQNLPNQWQWIFSENLKEKGKKTFFNKEVAPKNIAISDADLQRLMQLETLVAAYSKIDDISPLAPLAGCLKNLYLNVNEINDISVLATFSQLELLQLGGNNIADITPLAPLAGSLKHCQLNGNKISNINVLSNFTHLEILELAANQIDDVQPLLHLTQLRELNLIGNPANTQILREYLSQTEIFQAA